MKIRSYFSSVLFLFCFLVSAQTPPILEWEVALGGSTSDHAFSIISSYDNSYLIAGYTFSDDGDVTGHQGSTDYWVVKLDDLGNLIWQKTFGGSGADNATSIVASSDGGFVIAGKTTSQDGDVSNPLGGWDCWVIKIDGVGNLLWEKTFGGTGPDAANHIEQTDNGGYIISGWTSSNDLDVSGNNGGYDYWILEIDSIGNIIWQNALGGSGDEQCQLVKGTPDGGFIAVGSSDSNDGDVTGNHGGDGDMWIVKLNSQGTLVWQKSLGGSGNEIANSLIVANDGSAIVVGFSSSTNGNVTGNHGGDDFWVVKLDSLGNLIWEQSYGGSSNETANSIQVASDQNYIVAGFTTSSDGDVSSNNGISDIWILKIDTTGSLIWERTLGGTSYDNSKSIICADSGAILSAGNTASSDGDVTSNNGSNDYWIVKLEGDSMPECIVSIDPGNVVVDSFSNSYLVNLLINQGCSWSVSSIPNWVVWNSPNNGSGPFMFNYSVLQNTLPDPRTDTIYIANEPFIVTQLGATPNTSYTISANCDPDHPAIPVTPLSIAPLKICADGSDATELTVTISGSPVVLDDLEFRLAGDNGDLAYSGAFNFSYDTTSISVTTRFTHPTFVASGNFQYRADVLEVYNVNDPNTALASTPVWIYRSPIAFIHGFKGSQSTFQSLSEDLLLFSKYPSDWNLLSGSPLLHRADYKSNSSKSFIHNQFVVHNAITAVLQQAISADYSCGKATIIAHSMGGLLSRIYLQSQNHLNYQNDINRMITLNTPHYGTQLANYCTRIPGASILQPNGVCNSLFYLLSIFTSTGAVKDLKVDSWQIEDLNNLPQTDLVPSVTLASDENGDNDAWAQAVRAALGPAINTIDIYDSEDHDLIVPMSSQLSNLNLTSEVQQQWHIGSSSKIAMMDQVHDLLDVDPSGPEFSQTGFPQGGLIYAQPEGSGSLQNPLAKVVVDTLSIDLPIAGQDYSPNDIVTVDISYSGNISQMTMIVAGPSIQPITIDTTVVSQIIFQVPALATGTLNMFLLGGDGQAWTATDDSYININSAVVPDSIECTPENVTIPLGLTHYIEAMGYFGGTPVDLLSSGSLNIAYDAGLLAYLGDGIFQSLDTGATTIAFEYLGQMDTVWVDMPNDSSAVVAAFDYNVDLICASDSVQFENSSLGLVTDQTWNFPGGTPLSSTLSNPQVTYSSVGNYDVTLITTFVNGVDTLILNDLVQVVNAPDTSVTDNGASLSVDEPGMTYQWIDCTNGNLPISGASDQEFFPTDDGDYAVMISNGACVRTSNCHQWLGTGINSNSTDLNIVVVPNPTQGYFEIIFSKVEIDIQFVISDAIGRTVLEDNYQSTDKLELYLDEPPGIYYLNVTIGQQSKVFKLIKTE